MRELARTVFLLIFFGGTFLGVGNAEGEYLSARRLAETRDIGGGAYGGEISVSPDGKWVVFQLQDPDIEAGQIELSWMIVAARGDGTALEIADGGELDVNPRLAVPDGARLAQSAQWAPDSQSFAYTVKSESEVQIWLSKIGEVGRRQLTYGHRQVIDFRWSSDGSKIFFETGAGDEEKRQRSAHESKTGFLFDDRFDLLSSRSVVYHRCPAQGERGPSLVSVQRQCNPTLNVIEVLSGRAREATIEELDEYTALSSSRSGFDALNDRRYRTDVDRSKHESSPVWLEFIEAPANQGVAPFHRIHALVDGKEHICMSEYCKRQGGVIEGNMPYWFLEPNGEVIFQKHIGERFHGAGLYAWSPREGAVRKVVETEGAFSSCELADRELICLFENVIEPRKVVAIDLMSGSMRTLFDANEDLRDYSFTRIERLNWEDKFGNPTYGHLVYPVNYDPNRIYPLVVVTYQSRGFLRGGTGDEYPIHPLAAEGFFVLSQAMPLDLDEWALSVNTADRFETDLRGFESTLSSQEAAVRYLVEKGLVDERRVAITGFSNGARQTNYALINSNVFAAAIQSVGGSNPTTYYLLDSQSRASHRKWKNGPPHKKDSLWDSISIAKGAARVSAPLLINSSESEVLLAAEGVVRLQDAGKPVEMYVYPDGFHNKWRPDHRFAIYRRNIQWLKFWLQNAESDNPVSTGQYQRWRSLRDKHCSSLSGPESPNPFYCSRDDPN